MLHIDLPADLNFEDNDGNNVARLRDAVHPDRVTVGAILVAGRRGAWSWAQVLDVDDNWVTFRQITGAEAAALAPTLLEE